MATSGCKATSTATYVKLHPFHLDFRRRHHAISSRLHPETANDKIGSQEEAMHRAERRMSGLLIAALLFAPIYLHSQDSTSALTLEQKEVFLKKAGVKQKKDVNKGVTQTSRVTLSDGTVTHDASVQKVDDYQKVFQPQGGKAEFNFKDSYKFNIAAYLLAKQVGLGDMVPVSVERGNSAYTWWIDDVLMEEGERISKKVQAPDEDAWNKEMAIVRVFDQLIFNTDRNVGNLVIDKKWHVWMIDHTRAFRIRKDLPNPAALTRIDRGLLTKLKSLNETSLRKELGKVLSTGEISALLARRDLIVAAFEAKGDSALFDRPAR